MKRLLLWALLLAGLPAAAQTSFYPWNASNANISGLTSGYLPLAGSGSSLTGNSPIDYGVTAAGVLSSSAPWQVVNAGAFSASASYSYNASVINGCNPQTMFTASQGGTPSYFTAAVEGCVNGSTSSVASPFNMEAGGMFFAYGQYGSSNQRPVGIFAMGQAGPYLGQRPYGGNLLVQDTYNATTNYASGLAGLEIDTQPQYVAGSYSSNGVQMTGLNVMLYTNNGSSRGGTYPGQAINIGVGSTGGGISWWQNGINVNTGALGTASQLLNINPICNATGSGNCNGPALYNYYESWWDGTTYHPEGWTLQAFEGSGTNPTTDKLEYGHNAGTAPAGQAHYVDVANGISFARINSDSTLTVIEPSVASGYCIGTASASAGGIALMNLGTSQVNCTSGLTAGLGLTMTKNGTLSNLSVRCGTTGVNASSGVFTVWDTPSGSTTKASTGLTITYGTTTANTLVQDTTHTYAYAAGDLIQVSFSTQASETLAGCTASFNY